MFKLRNITDRKSKKTTESNQLRKRKRKIFKSRIVNVKDDNVKDDNVTVSLKSEGRRSISYSKYSYNHFRIREPNSRIRKPYSKTRKCCGSNYKKHGELKFRAAKPFGNEKENSIQFTKKRSEEDDED